MKYLVSFIAILILVTGVGQSNSDFAFKSFIKKDTVLLRWAPTDVTILKKGLKYGFIVERIDGTDQSVFEGNPSLKTFEIEPAKKKLSQATNSEKTKQYKSIIEGFVEDKGMKSEEQEYIFGVLLLSAGADKDLADLLNLSFVDNTINNGKNYQYRISVKSGDREYFTIKVDAKKESRHWDFGSLEAKAKNRNKEIFLSWNAEQLQNDYSAYWVERSSDSIKFNRVNQLPYFFFKSSDEKDKKLIDFIDTSAVAGETYYYRINGISHFGESGGYSNIIKVKLKKVLDGYVRLDTIYANKMDRLIEGQYIPSSKKDEKNLKEFILFKSKEKHKGFEVIDSKKASGLHFSFSSNSLLESGDRNYYKIGAVSTDNDTIYSFTKYFFTLDQIPPSKPEGLEGVVNDKGVVSLNWNKNPEEDIRGYRVFKSNSLKEEFVEVSTEFITLNEFSDTLPLNTLTSNIYYKIAAVDLNYNNSEHSEVVKLNKPDTIAPTACVFYSYSSLEEGMKLQWHNSSSEDIKSSQLYRKPKNGAEKEIVSWKDTTSFFVDTLANLGVKNNYIIKTEDLSGNVTLSKPISVIYETGKRPSVTGLKAEVDRQERHIKLSWEAMNEDVYSIKIYRAKEEGNYKLIKTIHDGTAVEFLDKNLYINNEYKYKIRVTYQSGISSDYSNEITIVY